MAIGGAKKAAQEGGGIGGKGLSKVVEPPLIKSLLAQFSQVAGRQIGEGEARTLSRSGKLPSVSEAQGAFAPAKRQVSQRGALGTGGGSVGRGLRTGLSSRRGNPLLRRFGR